MSVTRRVPALFALATVLTLVAYPTGWHVHVFLLANLLFAGLVGLDVLLTPRGKIFHLQWAFKRSDNLYFKAENDVGLYVHNISKHRLYTEVLIGMGDAGRFFRTVSSDMVHYLDSGEEKLFTYTTVPAKRGQFTFNEVFVRYRGVLGFCVKHITLPYHASFKVYPNVRDLSKFRLMMQKSRLLPQGDKAIKTFGVGTEFESLRTYVEGDDYRKINWPATAREGKLIVNQYRVERNQPVYILLDCARPMSYSVGGYKKLDYAINAALILSDIVNQQGDQAGLLAFDETVTAHVKPGKGAGHRNLLMETLYAIEGNRQTADYAGAFKTLCDKQKRRSLVFIFTDFEILEEAEELIANMAILKRRHMPFVVFMENEALSAMAAPTSRRENRKEYYLRETAEEFVSERKKIFRKLNAMRIPNVESTAENFAVAAVNRYIQLSR
ncbi:MAG: DUF58 domain-containing protein [Defluviitaleaceae bacterium]|nr:DUF58 domain-containing protein [Defluviitaleaceae bacterium]